MALTYLKIFFFLILSLARSISHSISMNELDYFSFLEGMPFAFWSNIPALSKNYIQLLPIPEKISFHCLA